MTIIWKKDLAQATGDLTGLVTIDEEDSKSLKADVDNFCDNSVNDLTGAGYDAARKYIDAVYVPLLDERIAINALLINRIKDSNNNMEKYMDDDEMLDTSVLGDLIQQRNILNSKISTTQNAIRNMDEDSKEKKELKSKIQGYRTRLNELNRQITKLEKLEPTSNNIYRNYIATVQTEIYKYANKIATITPVSGEISTEPAKTGTETYPPGTTSYLGSTTSGGGSSSGGSGSGSGSGSGGGGTITPGKTAVQVAASLVGMTSAQLAADVNNGVYNIDNYESGEAWNVKFLHDLIRRDPANIKLLEDYYNNPEEYPDPINSLDSLLKYSMKDGTNIEYNWSSGSIETITQYNTSKGFTPVSYTEYKPQTGDIVFFDSSSKDGTFKGNTGDMSSADRVGIIESINTFKGDDGKEKTVITVIEGDYGDNPDTSTVVRKVYEADSKEILGYGTIKEYKKETDTSNNHNGTQNGIIKEEPETPEEPEDTAIHLKENDSAGNVSGESGGTVDYEGVQRDAEGNVIGKVDVEKSSDGTVTVEEKDIPSSNTKVKEDIPDEIDMSDYSEEHGEHYENIDPSLIEWNLEEIDE